MELVNKMQDTLQFFSAVITSVVGTVAYCFTNFASKKEVASLKEELDKLENKSDTKFDTLTTSLNRTQIELAELKIEIRNLCKILTKLADKN